MAARGVVGCRGLASKAAAVAKAKPARPPSSEPKVVAKKSSAVNASETIHHQEQPETPTRPRRSPEEQARHVLNVKRHELLLKTPLARKPLLDSSL